MSTVLKFFAEGHPGPGGSKTGYVPTYKNGDPVRGPGGRIIVNIVEAGGKRTKEWRKVVAWAGKLAMKGEALLIGPIKCQFKFIMPRPKADFNSKGQLKDSAARHHLSAPDALKLARSTEDALTKIVWQDDSLVVCGGQEKRYQITPQERIGCEITIEAFEDDEQKLL